VSVDLNDVNAKRDYECHHQGGGNARVVVHSAR
jgi:hypothetical protein